MNTLSIDPLPAVNFRRIMVFGRAHGWLALAAILALVPAPVLAQAPGPGSGAIEGRVVGATNGVALGKARVAVEGTGQETITDDDGRFRLRGLPPGRAVLNVSYVGYGRQKVEVNVITNDTVRREIEMAFSDRPGAAVGETPVRLAEFTVVEQREITAQALAMNEQRAAPNLISVVALDEYGDLGQENVGDFLRFLPGLTIGSAGLTASEISVRGLPADTTQIMVDGNVVTSSEAGRVVPPHIVSLANVTRAEVTKVPTPDAPAGGLGGTVNLKRRNAFERRTPLLSYSVYQLLNTDSGITFGGGPRGQLPGVSPRFHEPSWSLSYVHPLNERLGVTAGVGSTWRKRGMDGRTENPTWNLVNLFQRTSQYSHLRSIVKTRTGQVGADWRVGPRDTLSANFEYKDRWVMVPRDLLLINYGAGAVGDATFTQGAATGVGSVTMGGGANQLTNNVSRIGSLRYVHRGDGWELSASGAVSAAASRTRDLRNGHFSNITATLSNLIIRGDGIGEGGATIPTRYTVADRAGQRVNIHDGANYTINSATSNEIDSESESVQARVDLQREFRGLSLRVGAAFNRQERDRQAGSVTYNFQPNGSAAAADRLAGKFDVFDRDYNASTFTFYGQPGNWISVAKGYELFRQQPSWWVDNAATSYINRVNGSTLLREDIAAAYLRADFKLLANRLRVVTGVRYEETSTEGWGPLNDPTARYVRDAAGNIVRNAAGQPVFRSADALVRAQQQYQERGARGARRYDGFYPSLNGTYRFSDELLLRVGYARTIGRPSLNFIIPGVSVPDSEAPSPRTFTVVNTGLRPWRASNYDLSLESYQFKGGFGSIGVFQKDITDFFNVVTTELTPDLIAQYGIPAGEVDPGDLVATRTNGGNARIRGLELMYRQQLQFLPWAFGRSLQVFVNYNKLSLGGNRESDFGSFTPSNWAWGISLIRPRWSVKFNDSYQGEIRRTPVAVSVANGIPANTYDYQGERRRLSLSAEYSLYRRFSLFGSWADIGGLDVYSRRYAPGTPEYARITNFGDVGSTLTVGIKGDF
jgi:TonB-dependent receptor